MGLTYGGKAADEVDVAYLIHLVDRIDCSGSISKLALWVDIVETTGNRMWFVGKQNCGEMQ